jgi:hypothetical protein
LLQELFFNIFIPLIKRKALVQTDLLLLVQEPMRNVLKYLTVKLAAKSKHPKTEFVTGVTIEGLVKNRVRFGVIQVIVVATKKIVEIHVKPWYIRLKIIKNCI